MCSLIDKNLKKRQSNVMYGLWNRILHNKELDVKRMEALEVWVWSK